MTWPLPTSPFSQIAPQNSFHDSPTTDLINLTNMLCYFPAQASESAGFSPWSSPDLFSPPFLLLHFPAHPLIKYPHGILVLYLNFVLYLIIEVTCHFMLFVCALLMHSKPHS